VIDRGTGHDSSIAAYNAIVRAGWKEGGIAALEDDAERPEFAPNNVTGNSTYYNPDQTHLTGGDACVTSTGYGLRCVGLSKIVNTLDGANKTNPDSTTSNAFVATDANNYVVQTPTAAATYQLVDCSWITGLDKTVVNGSSTYTISVTTTSSQTITGSASVAPNTIATFTAQVSAGNAGGCYWLRTQ